MLNEGHILNGTYRIVRFVGEGGMGTVYEATHSRLAGRYAVKVLLQSLSANPEALAHFDREAKITSSLQHPNIVHVVDYDSTPEGVEYLVMEYLQGETLTNRLSRQGPLAPMVVSEIVDQISAGVSAAHAHNIVHRDLKPDNIFMVNVEGRRGELVKILDFGISKMRDAARRPDGPVSALMGTPQYMSPEQCQGRTREVDGASDQFALAAITYEMLTGRAPFPGDSLGDVLARVLYQDPPAMGVDPLIEAVVLRGLAKAKRDRFPSVTSFAEALQQAAVAGEQRVLFGDEPTPGRFGIEPSQGVYRRESQRYERSASQTPPPVEGPSRLPQRRSGRWRDWGVVFAAVAGASGVIAFIATKRQRSEWQVEYNALRASPITSTATAGSGSPATQPTPSAQRASAAEVVVQAKPSSPGARAAEAEGLDDRSASPQGEPEKNGGAKSRAADDARANRTAAIRRTVMRGAPSKVTRPRTLPPPPLDEDAPLPLDENVGDNSLALP